MQTAMVHGDWRPPEPTKETFGAYGRRWLDSRIDLGPRTRELYEALWKRWLEPTFKSVTLAKLTTEGWRTWYLKACAEHPGSTQPGKAYRLARAMLNTAVDDGLLRSNPCRIKGAGKEQPPERPTATPEQVAAIADNIDGRYRAMVLVAAYGSLRFGELAGLRRKRVNLLHGTVAVAEQAVELAGGKVIFGPPKSDAGNRTVALPRPVVAELEIHLNENVGNNPDALLFTSPQGHPLRRTKFRPVWAAALGLAGVTGLRFHDLRHTGATLAAATGATVRELMARLSHSTPSVALRYQHSTQDRDRMIADALEAVMAGAAPAPRSLVPAVRDD